MTAASGNRAKAASRPRSRFRIAMKEAFSGGGQDTLDGAGFLLLLVTVALTAAVDPALGISHGVLGALPGVRIVELFAFLTTFVTFFSRSDARPLRPLALPLAALAGIVLLGVGQLVPLPTRLLQISTPVNATIYHEARETLSLFGAALPSPRISIAPSETAGVLLGLLAAAAVFLSAANLLRSRARIRVLAAVVVLGAFVGSARELLAGFPIRAAGIAAASAARLEIALALAFGFVWTEVLTGRARSAPGLDPSERIERRILPFAGRLAVWLALAALLVATGSRSGAAAAAVTAVLLPLAASRHPRSRGRWKAAAALAFAAAAVAILLFFTLFRRGGPPGDATLPAPSPAAFRAASVEAWREFPVFGSGLGSFAEGFARVERGATPERVREPPSEALGVLVTGGAVGAALAGVLILTLAFLSCRAWLRQNHREESAYALAGLGSLFSLLLHGLFAPVFAGAAVPICLAAVLGASWSAARAGSSESEAFLR